MNVASGVTLSLAVVFVAGPAHAQDAPHRQPDFSDRLAFEAEHVDDTLSGWGGGPKETIHVDGEVSHGGSFSARVTRTAESEGSFSTVTTAIPVDFRGARILLEAYLRTSDVEEWAGLWLRVDGKAGTLAFDNMQDRAISGTTGWTMHRIELSLAEGAQDVYFGALVSGPGTIWLDDVSLLVDGEPVSGTLIVEPEPTVLELDDEFDQGSGIDITALTDTQVRNLDLLCRVWGFLKYHHPVVTGGELHWDYELFRVLPLVLVANDADAGRAAILGWAESKLGIPPLCDPCAQAPGEIPLPPDLSWLRDRATLGDALHDYLAVVHERRHAGGEQFYVSLARGVRNPLFENEVAYKFLEDLDAGFRILALFRYWNIIQYWFPYRDVIGEDWNAIIAEYLPKLVAAAGRDDYRRTLHSLIARVNDTHANLWSSIGARPPGGDCKVPIAVRFIDGQAMIAEVPDGETSLRMGDVITAVDGVPISTLIEEWSPYYAASNEPTRLRDIARALTNGECGPCALRIRREDAEHEVATTRTSGVEVRRHHDRPGDTFQMLSDDLAYVKLSSVARAEAAGYVERARGTRGLVIDIRNYPSEFMVFALGQHLVTAAKPFVKFTKGDLANPGAFSWTDPLLIPPRAPRYEGRIAILVDEVSQSQAEYTTMAFRSVPGAVVVGSTTAGADGNASWFPMPGGERSMISGIGVFYPDGTPTQRVGIVPDVEVLPTLEGMRAGRDEVLEAAIRHILGPDVPDDAVMRMASLQKTSPTPR